MPKYWGKQIFAQGRFPKVGQKQKTEKRKKKRERKLVITMAKLRMAHTGTHGKRKPPGPKTASDFMRASHFVTATNLFCLIKG